MFKLRKIQIFTWGKNTRTHTTMHTYISMLCQLRGPRTSDTLVAINTSNTQILDSVLVYLDYYNKTPFWVTYKWQKFHSHSSEGYKHKIWVPRWSGSGEGPMKCCGGQLLNVSLHGRRDEVALWLSFIRTLIAFMWTLSPRASHLPKAPSLNTISLSIRFSVYEFWVQVITVNTNSESDLGSKYPDMIFHSLPRSPKPITPT